MGVTPPLAIIQARLHSERLPKKMLQDVGGHPLLWWGWDRAIKRYGRDHTVIAVPSEDAAALRAGVPEAHFFAWSGAVWDVLQRLWVCAHRYRNDPDDQIVRITPDDWPVDLERERVSLGFLDWHQTHTLPLDEFHREHIGYTLFETPPVLSPLTVEINTQADLDYVRTCVQQNQRLHRSSV